MDAATRRGARGRGIAGGVALAALVALAQGCKDHAAPSAQTTLTSGPPETREERLNLLSNPSLYLQASDLRFDDDASDHEQLLAVTVTNASHFAVRDLEGDITWLDDQGGRLGSSRFSLKGAIAPGERKTFASADGTLTTGTLMGGALRVTLAFHRVNVVD